MIGSHVAPASLLAGFADRQADFVDAILDPRKPAPAGLVGPDGRPSAKRFAVYRNNVIVGLIETLKAAYPVIHRLVGDTFFMAMARDFAMAQPPASPIMLDYGAGFPAFVGCFEPAAVLPYLEDVARLERAWAEAYHAAEGTPLLPSALAQVPAASLPGLRLSLHPSVRIVRSAFPIVGIWQVNIDGDDLAAASIEASADDALVARPDAEVEIRRLPVGAAAFMEALQTGAPIIDAVKEGLSVSPQFDLAGVLRGMVEARVMVGCEIRPARSVEAA